MKLTKILTPNRHGHKGLLSTYMSSSTDTRYEINTCIQFFLSDLDYSLEPGEPCEVTGITVRALRHKFIVVAQVDGVPTRREIPREDVELFPPFAGCTGDCGSAGPLGSTCEHPDCLDSGNIFADDLPYIDCVTLGQ